jgi:radical SAM protein with 4Fe4S-binding SPASM domain
MQEQVNASGAPAERHILEDILSIRLVQKLLGYMTTARAGNASLLERLARNYNNPALAGFARWPWRLPGLAIDLALRRAKLDREFMTRKLFHHRPTMKSLALTGRSIARFGLTAPQRFVAPLMVVWNITRACNLRCKHCYQNAAAKPDPDELTLEEKLRAVDSMADDGVCFLAIAGGEPLVSKDLWPVLERAREREIHTTVATNGTLLTAENVRRLISAGVKYVEVSIDDLDSARHDAFRGQAGCWRRSIQGIRNSVAGGMRTGLAACFTRHNVETVDEMIEFAVSLGCATFSHFNFIPVGRGREMASEDLTPEQREWLMRKLVAHLQAGRINIISTAPQFGRACVAYAPPDGVYATGHAGSGAGRKTMVLSRYIGGCGAGRCYCAIQPNGDITPCVYIPGLKVGNITQARLSEVWECSLFDTLSDRTRRERHCAVCRDRAYCGGCRARALAYTGDITAADPGCRNNQALWDGIVSRTEPPAETLVTPAVRLPAER